MKAWPPKPGLTDITRTRSRLSRTYSRTAGGVEGFSATPAFAPSSRVWGRGRARGGDASAWAVNTLGRPPEGRPDGEVRHEVAVHHVHVEPVRAGGLYPRDGFPQRREVRREDGRGNLDHVVLTIADSRVLSYSGSARWPLGSIFLIPLQIFNPAASFEKNSRWYIRAFFSFVKQG